MKPIFSLGETVIISAALRVLAESGESPVTFLARHARGDWGDCCDEDANLSDLALIDGSRLFSVYHSVTGRKVYVITEAADHAGLRAATTILLPENY